MSSTKADRFKVRRRALRRRRLCVKCGETEARPGHCECIGCALVKSVKSKLRRQQSRAVNQAVRRAALAQRLTLLEAEASRVREEIERIPA